MHNPLFFFSSPTALPCFRAGKATFNEVTLPGQALYDRVKGFYLLFYFLQPLGESGEQGSSNFGTPWKKQLALWARLTAGCQLCEISSSFPPPICISSHNVHSYFMCSWACWHILWTYRLHGVFIHIGSSDSHLLPLCCALQGNNLSYIFGVLPVLGIPLLLFQLFQAWYRRFQLTHNKIKNLTKRTTIESFTHHVLYSHLCRPLDSPLQQQWAQGRGEMNWR